MFLSPPLSLILSLVALVSLLPLDASATKYDFGEKMLAWVRNDARRQSLELAANDHNERVINAGLMGITNAKLFLLTFNGTLEELTKTAQQQEVTFSGIDVNAAAFERKRAATKNIEQLHALAKELNRHEKAVMRLTKPESLDEFYTSGHHHVGRATLLESIINTSQTLKPTLPETYYGVTISTDGNNTSVKPDNNMKMVYAIGYGLLITPNNPYAQAAGFLLMTGTALYTGLIDDEQRREIEEQKTILANAFRELTTTLPSPEEMHAHYLKSTEKSWAVITPTANELLKVFGEAKQAWQIAMASQMARVRLSETILTGARLRAILDRQPGFEGVQKYQDNATSIKLIRELQDFSLAVTEEYASAINGCHNSTSALAVENTLDSLYEGSFVANAITRDERLASVHSTAKSLSSQFTEEEQQLTKLRPLILKKKCSTQSKSSPKKLLKQLKPVRTTSWTDTQSPSIGTSIHPESFRSGDIMSAFGASSTAFAADDQTLGMCLTIYQEGTVLSCDPGNNSRPFNENFSNNGRDPITDILVGSRDGGYAADARRLGQNVDAAKDNVNVRISDLKKRVEAKRDFLPTWSASTTAYSSSASHRISELTKAQTDFQANFTNLYGAQLEEALAEMRSFSSSPFNVEVSGALAARLSGVTTNFPGIDRTRIRSEGPLIPSANPRGEPNPLNEVERERGKQVIAFQQVRDRVARNIRENKKDPVFNSISDVYKTDRIANQYTEFSHMLMDRKGAAYQRFGNDAVNAGKRYLEESAFLRAYADGNASPTSVPRQGIGDWSFTARAARESLERFVSCSKQYGDHASLMQRTPCNIFMYEAMSAFYNVDKSEFIIKRGANRDYMMANEFADYVSTSRQWKTIGTIRNQNNIDAAIGLAVQGRPVVGVYKAGGHGHVFTILPTVAAYQEADPKKRAAWGNLYLPQVANFGLDACQINMERCFIDGPVSKGIGLTKPEQIEAIILWVRDYP